MNAGRGAAPAGRGNAPAAGRGNAAAGGAASGPPAAPVIRATSTTSYYDEPITHRITNAGERLFRFMVVTNASAGDQTNTESGAGFPGKPELSNRWFRAYRLSLAPGQATESHRHTTESVIFQISDGKAIAVGPMTFELYEQGRWAWFDEGKPHEIRNVGTVPSSSSRSKSARPSLRRWRRGKCSGNHDAFRIGRRPSATSAHFQIHHRSGRIRKAVARGGRDRGDAARIAVRERAAEVVIGYAGDQPGGFALFFQTFSTFVGKPGMYLEDLFVAPEWRRHGLGRALLARLARIAVERGYGRVEWSVLDWNAPTIAFYKALGARPMDEWTVFRLTGDSIRALAETK